MKRITLTLNPKDTRIINDDDDIEDIKFKMITEMYYYVMLSMKFGTFCDMCDIEIKEVEESE